MLNFLHNHVPTFIETTRFWTRISGISRLKIVSIGEAVRAKIQHQIFFAKKHARYCTKLDAKLLGEFSFDILHWDCFYHVNRDAFSTKELDQRKNDFSFVRSHLSSLPGHCVYRQRFQAKTFSQKRTV